MTLVSCSEKAYFLPRPDNTNLSLWITQKVSQDDLKDLEFYPGMFGGDRYVDNLTTIKENDQTWYQLPQEHVIYEITAYPDYSSGGSFVTKIEITDPDYYVYDLNIKSSDEDIKSIMTTNGFEVFDNENIPTLILAASKKNIGFLFYKDKITISAEVTNKNNIIF